MAYITTVDNRYIGEHSCGLYHYGKMDLIRPCCVEDCKKQAANAARVAMTNQHPGYKMYQDAFNSLTDAEQALCPKFRIRYDGEIQNLRTETGGL
jgi:hypothetical protein